MQLGDINSRMEAVRLIKEVLEKEPERASDRLVLAEIYDREGKWSNAKETMLELLSSDKHKRNPLVLIKFVEMLLRHDEANEAGPYMDQLVKLKYDKDPIFIAAKAYLLKEKGQTADAISLLKSQINRPLAPSSVPQLKQAGDQFVLLAKDSPDAEKYLAEAEAMYREFVEESPENLLVLARFLGEHRSLDAAYEVGAKALENKTPVEQVAQLGLGLLRNKPDQLNDKLLATEEGWLKQALDKQSDSIPLNLLMADFYDLKGNYDGAITTYRKIKDRSDLTGLSKVTVYNNLAFMLATHDKRGDEALPLIEAAIKEIGPASELLDTRGVVQLVRGKTREAIADLQSAVQSGPSGVKYFHLALRATWPPTIARLPRTISIVPKAPV